MARIYPSPLPGYIRSDPLRGAEVEIYDALDEQLDDDHVVFYSRPWLGQDRFGHEIDGEVDFTIAHPKHGVLVIEVKGGIVARDGKTGQWTSKDGWGVVHKIKDPVKQARDGKYRLLEKLKEMPKWGKRFVRITHGVLLPGSSSPRHDLGPDMPMEIFAFAEDLGRLNRWVAKRLGVGSGREHENPVDTDGIECLERLLASSFRLNLKIGGRLALGDRAIKILTEEQYHYLDSLADFRRVLVKGGAGTGKTMLAVRQTQLYSAAGYRTLLTCFNAPLGTLFSSWFSTNQNVMAGNFHQLCSTILGPEAINRALENAKGAEDVAFSTIIPACLIDHVAKESGPYFDAFIVDEAQDFHREWWAALEAIASVGRKPIVRAFADPNQQVYRKAMPVLDDRFDIVFPLTRNVRNTQQIFTVTAPYFISGITRASGPDGQEVVLDSTPRNASESIHRILYQISQLVKNENVSIEDIAVLAVSRSEAERIIEFLLAKGYAAGDAAEPQIDKGIRVDTVRRFKGLEAAVVIIHWADDLMPQGSLFYVAATRAKGLLIVNGSKGVLEQLAIEGNTTFVG